MFPRSRTTFPSKTKVLETFPALSRLVEQVWLTFPEFPGYIENIWVLLLNAATVQWLSFPTAEMPAGQEEPEPKVVGGKTRGETLPLSKAFADYAPPVRKLTVRRSLFMAASEFEI